MKDARSTASDSAVAAALASYDAVRDLYRDLLSRLASGEDPMAVIDALSAAAPLLEGLSEARVLNITDPEIAEEILARAQSTSEACQALRVAIEEVRVRYGAVAQEDVRLARALRGYLSQTGNSAARYLDTEG